MFSLTQIIKPPTRETCISTSLIGHIFASVPERTSHEDIISVGLSDHQPIYCTKKYSTIKIGDVHLKI